MKKKVLFLNIYTDLLFPFVALDFMDVLKSGDQLQRRNVVCCEKRSKNRINGCLWILIASVLTTAEGRQCFSKYVRRVLYVHTYIYGWHGCFFSAVRNVQIDKQCGKKMFIRGRLLAFYESFALQKR